MSNTKYVLSVICNQLKRQALYRPWKEGKPIKDYQQKLSGGLRITLLLDQTKNEWYLELSRLHVDPSDTECLIVKQLIGTPPGAKEQRTVIGFNDHETHKIRWRWPAEDPRTEGE